MDGWYSAFSQEVRFFSPDLLWISCIYTIYRKGSYTNHVATKGGRGVPQKNHNTTTVVHYFYMPSPKTETTSLK